MFGELTLDFIHWLAAKSREGYIAWERRPNMITAVVDRWMLVQFLTSRSLDGEEVWRLFTIFSPSGEELYRATHGSATTDALPVRSFVDTLFSTAVTLSQIN